MLATATAPPMTISCDLAFVFPSFDACRTFDMPKSVQKKKRKNMKRPETEEKKKKEKTTNIHIYNMQIDNFIDFVSFVKHLFTIRCVLLAHNLLVQPTEIEKK